MESGKNRQLKSYVATSLRLVQDGIACRTEVILSASGGWDLRQASERMGHHLPRELWPPRADPITELVHLGETIS
ncbi:hypothetical protein DMB37_00480 [Nocardia sp. CS682]|nr:hypothetical protein DMB37_00480 [Nocardia sp. CS682]